MDPVLRYAILSTCILLIGLIPFFIIRIYMFTIKSHFLLSKTAQRISLVTNLLSFILFLSLLIFYTSIYGFFSVSFYVVMVLTFVLVLLIYKRLDMRPIAYTYIVSFTRLNSKKTLIKNLSSHHVTHISTQSTFSFLTHLKYISLNKEEVEEVATVIKSKEQVYVSFKGIAAHIFFAIYVALVSVAYVSFTIFFNVLIT